METNKQTEKTIDFLSIKMVIDQFFTTNPHTLVQEELWKWFVFSVSSKGLSISNLSENEFAQFSDQLSKLTKAVYTWTNSQKLTAINREENIHV